MDNLISSVLADLKNGKMVIVTDDTERENEGDLVIAAEKIDAAAITFMAKKASGLICLSITQDLATKLKLQLMNSESQESMNTAFTMSIDAKNGISTGISSYDRAHTILTAIHPNSDSKDIVTPGHMFPIIANEGGLFKRRGHTEASIELVKMAGLFPASVICEIMDDNGNMLRGKELQDFATLHQLKLISIQEIVEHLNKLPTSYGFFDCFSVMDKSEKHSNNDHLVLYCGNIENHSCLVRIHSECLTGDVFGSLKCDCGPQLKFSLEKIAKHNGILIYLRQEGRDIGLFNKIKAYKLQESGFDTVQANLELGLPVDNRDYTVAAHIIKKLNPSKIRLMTNNPDKISSLRSLLSQEIERVEIQPKTSDFNRNYLCTKVHKLGHMIEI